MSDCALSICHRAVKQVDHEMTCLILQQSNALMIDIGSRSRRVEAVRNHNF